MYVELVEWGGRGGKTRRAIVSAILLPLELTETSMWKYSLGIGKDNKITRDQNRWTVFWCRWRGHQWGEAYAVYDYAGDCYPQTDCERCGDTMEG